MKTINDIDLLEPTKVYNGRLKLAFHENVEEFFDELVKTSSIKTEENKATVAKYYKSVKEGEDATKKVNGKKFLKGFLLFIGILFIVLAIFGIIVGATNKTSSSGAFIGGGAGLVVLGITSVVVAIVVVKKQVASLQEKLDKILAKAEEEKNEADMQMSPLNALFDWNMPARLINKTTSLIQMDETFDPNKFQYMHEKYGFSEDDSTDTSTKFVQSGSILGNPFVIEQNYVQDMVDEVYHGSLTIHYTTTSYVNGKAQTVHRTQTLHATYTAPKPDYFDRTWLIYANEAAPRLSFSRYPSEANKMDEKALDKFIKKQDKELDKLVEKSMSSTHPFNRLQNTEFEALFNALDRDNDVEFRLLFTPLAQRNIVELLKDKENYGDDFIFMKRKCLNYISSDHSQTQNLFISSPNNFIDFDYERCREHFVQYFDDYFKSFFFDLTPLLSIPLYSQTKSRETIYKEKYRGNITSYEVESSANNHDVNIFKPDGAITNTILKSEFVKKVPNGDLVNIHSYSFIGINRVAYVNVLGGDGRYHAVPVPWIEYQPVDKVTPFVVQKAETTRNEFNNISSNDAFNKVTSSVANDNAILFMKKFVSYVPSGTNTLDEDLLNSLGSKKED